MKDQDRRSRARELGGFYPGLTERHIEHECDEIEEQIALVEIIDRLAPSGNRSR